MACYDFLLTSNTPFCDCILQVLVVLWHSTTAGILLLVPAELLNPTPWIFSWRFRQQWCSVVGAGDGISVLPQSSDVWL